MSRTPLYTIAVVYALIFLFLLLSSLGLAQQPSTPCLHLKLTGDAALNDNFYKLDDHICTLERTVNSLVATLPTTTSTSSTSTTSSTVPTTTSSTSTSSTSTTSTTLQVLPAAGPSDVNCPTTTPAVNTYVSSQNGYINAIQTCATGTRSGGYDVTAVTMWIQNATAGKHIMCSVYDSATPRNHLNAGCDTASTVLAANPSTFVTMAVPGPCHLATSTRYWITCQIDDNLGQFGYSNASCPTCWTWVSQVYGTWTATLGTGSSYNFTPAWYLTIR